jgi:flavorubredoxin
MGLFKIRLAQLICIRSLDYIFQNHCHNDYCVETTLLILIILKYAVNFFKTP